jgi:hypothetical protein
MGEWRYSSTILDFGTRCRRVVSFTPRPLYSLGKSTQFRWISGWIGPTVELDAVEKRKVSCPYWESNPGGQARSPSVCGLRYLRYIFKYSHSNNAF